MRRFVCENPRCPQRTFDECFEGIGRGEASERALAWFADLSRGRATRAVARDLWVSEHYLRLAVGQRRARAAAGTQAGSTPTWSDECAVGKPFAYATVFSDPARGVVIDAAPGRDGAAIWVFTGLFSRAERAQVQVVSIDCHNAYQPRRSKSLVLLAEAAENRKPEFDHQRGQAGGSRFPHSPTTGCGSRSTLAAAVGHSSTPHPAETRRTHNRPGPPLVDNGATLPRL